ncbi:Com family DNA-binding transcriptional regulator [Marinobacterium litorale]|uniref:Com family DNA-binding transcriptional regulator n=1 Tax=Marinobacterium litorale TaxID=404770 RepID=UPI000A03463D|nr:Com family DNA-binding transcriptional regulator [Marinobacterium litorale]
MQEIRCSKCQKLLAKAQFLALEIKCPRCNTMNSLRVLNPAPERQRAPIKEMKHGKAHHPVDRRQA